MTNRYGGPDLQPYCIKGKWRCLEWVDIVGMGVPGTVCVTKKKKKYIYIYMSI
jgi:hypothetical protein